MNEALSALGKVFGRNDLSIYRLDKKAAVQIQPREPNLQPAGKRLLHGQELLFNKALLLHCAAKTILVVDNGCVCLFLLQALFF